MGPSIEKSISDPKPVAIKISKIRRKSVQIRISKFEDFFFENHGLPVENVDLARAAAEEDRQKRCCFPAAYLFKEKLNGSDGFST
jgi:hypothetical protein